MLLWIRMGILASMCKGNTKVWPTTAVGRYSDYVVIVDK